MLPILSASSLFFACFPPTLPSEEAVTLIRLTLLQARAAGCELKLPPPPPTPHRWLVQPPPPPPTKSGLGVQRQPSESLCLTQAFFLDYHLDSEMLLDAWASSPPSAACLQLPESPGGVGWGKAGGYWVSSEAPMLSTTACSLLSLVSSAFMSPPCNRTSTTLKTEIHLVCTCLRNFFTETVHVDNYLKCNTHLAINSCQHTSSAVPG